MDHNICTEESSYRENESAETCFDFLEVKVVKNVSQGSHFTMLEVMLHTDKAANVLQIYFLSLYRTSFPPVFSVITPSTGSRYFLSTFQWV